MEPLYYESRTFEQDGRFYMTLRLTRGTSTWTSKPVLLEGAESFEDASKQAIEQVTALHRTLRSE